MLSCVQVCQGKERLDVLVLYHSPRHILLDTVKAPLGAVLANIGKIKCESPHFRRSVRPWNCNVLFGRRKILVTWVTWTETKFHFFGSHSILQPFCNPLGVKHLDYCTGDQEEHEAARRIQVSETLCTGKIR